MKPYFAVAPVRSPLIFAACLATVALLSGGCQKAETKPATGKPKIALVMKSLANEFFSTMAGGAKKHQAAHADAYDLIVNGIKNETEAGDLWAFLKQFGPDGKKK